MKIRDKGLRDLLLKAEELGCVVEPTKSLHVRIRVPGGGVVHTSSSPSDIRVVKNTRAQLRRAGLEGI